MNVEIYFPKENLYRPLNIVSPVVDALARTQFDDWVKRVRLFAHPSIAERLAAVPDLSDCLSAAVGGIS